MKKSAKYYSQNTEARKVKAATDKKINSRPEQIKKRVEANRANRKAQANGTAMVGDGRDASHTKRGIVMKPQSINRASKKDSPGDVRSRGKKS
jgi:hypothetical protein